MENRLENREGRQGREGLPVRRSFASLASFAVQLLFSLSSLAAAPAVGSGQSPRSGAVQAWVTTGDKTKLLARAPNVRFATAEQIGTTTQIDVDTAITLPGDGRLRRGDHRRVGVADSDEALAGRSAKRCCRSCSVATPGIGLSFTRLTIGASDFSRTHYSFDDVPPGESDSDARRTSRSTPNRADMCCRSSSARSPSTRS